jgi:hypothetical protein
MTTAQLQQAEQERSAQVPEIGTQGIRSVAPEAGMGTAAAAITTTDSAIRPRDEQGAFVPSELSQIIKQSDPDVEILYTPEGTERAYNPKTQQLVDLNQPGISPIDAMRTLGVAAAFAPVGGAAATGAGITGKILGGGSAGLATETAIQAGQEAAGGEFDTEDVGLAGSIGAALPVVGAAVKAATPALKETGSLIRETAQKAYDSLIGKVEGRLRGKIQNIDRQVLDVLTSKRGALESLDVNTLEGVLQVAQSPSVANRVKLATKTGVDRSAALSFAGSGKRNKQKFQQMVTSARAENTGSALAATSNRFKPMGESVVERWDIVSKVNKDAGKQVDEVAQRTLDGLEVEIEPIREAFNEFISSLNAQVNDEGQLLFKESSIKHIPEARSLVQRAWSVVRGSEGDALDLHTAKRVLDEIVAYGAPAEGITGSTGGAVKALRKEINDTLGDLSPEYGKINKKYSETIKSLIEFRDATGNIFDPSDDVGTDILGFLVKDVNSKEPVRLKLKQAVSRLEETAMKHGNVKMFKDDLSTQALYNGELEKALTAKYPDVPEEILKILPVTIARVSRHDRKGAVGELFARVARATYKRNPDIKALNALERLTKESK